MNVAAKLHPNAVLREQLPVTKYSFHASTHELIRVTKSQQNIPRLALV